MNLHDLFENEQSVNWVVPYPGDIERGEETVVWVDPFKIDAAWKYNNNSYVGPNGTINAIGNRYNDFGQWLKQGIPVKMPEIYLRNGIPDFSNGRHRFRWMLDHGATAIPVVIPTEFAKELEKLFGTSEHKTILSEDAAKDLYHNNRAAEILKAFKNWLKSTNAKIKDVMARSNTENGMMYTIPVKNFMNGAYRNLRIGFAFEKNPLHDGFQTTGTENDTKVYIVCQVFDFDISDVVASNLHTHDPVMIHEIIHYLDRMRQRSKDGQLKSIKGTSIDSKGYHSDPLEFNAYFQQGMHKVINVLKNEKIGSYNDFRGKYLNFFDYFDKLTPEYKQKFERRFYKLYEFLLSKEK